MRESEQQKSGVYSNLAGGSQAVGPVYELGWIYHSPDITREKQCQIPISTDLDVSGMMVLHSAKSYDGFLRFAMGLIFGLHILHRLTSSRTMLLFS